MHIRLLVRLAGACLSLAVGACDPCFGVNSCNTEPRLAIEGTFVEHIAGAPSAGVQVDVIRTGGVELASDSIAAVSDAQGHWQIGVAARTAGEAVVDISVRTKDFGVYRVRGIHLTTSDRRGQGTVLPTWVVDPYFNYAVELHYRVPEDRRVAGANVEFHRTGGVEYYIGSGGDVFNGQTDAAGRIVLFLGFAHAKGVGDLIGDLVVHLPPPYAVDTIHGLHLASTQLLDVPSQVIVFDVGPSSATSPP